jgi:hypothetical protein
MAGPLGDSATTLLARLPVLPVTRICSGIDHPFHMHDVTNQSDVTGG